VVNSQAAVLGAGRPVALEAELAAAAGEVAVDKDALALRAGGDAGAHGGHFAGNIVAGDEWQPCVVRMAGVLCTQMSSRFTAPTATFTTTLPAAGVGSERSTSWRTSGPPSSEMTIARISRPSSRRRPGG
jgi:hypothetical protein